MLQLSATIGLIFLALSRCAAPNSQASDDQDGNSREIVLDSYPNASSGVCSDVHLQFDYKALARARGVEIGVSHHKAFLEDDHDQSTTHYPNTILHARDSASRRLEKRGLPWCLLCRQLCTGNREDGFVCPTHFKEFGWTCHQRGIKDPQRLVLFGLSIQKPRCLICRGLCEKNTVQGCICQEHFKDFGATCVHELKNSQPQVPTHPVSSVLQAWSANVPRWDLGHQSCYADNPRAFESTHLMSGATNEDVVYRPHRNKSLQARALHTMFGQLAKEVPSPKCSSCHQTCYTDHHHKWLCPTSVGLDLICRNEPITARNNRHGPLGRRALRPRDNSPDQLGKRLILQRSNPMRCTICHRECYESGWFGTFFCPVHSHLGWTCEDHQKQDRLHEHSPRTNVGRLEQYRQSGHHLRIRQSHGNLHARHPKPIRVRKCVICNSTCREVRKQVFQCHEHPLFEWACDYTSRELADARLYFDPHKAKDGLQTPSSPALTRLTRRGSHTEWSERASYSRLDVRIYDHYSPVFVHAQDRFRSHHTSSGLRPQERESTQVDRCPTCSQLCIGEILRGFRCPRHRGVDCVRVAEPRHKPEHQLLGHLQERTPIAAHKLGKVLHTPSCIFCGLNCDNNGQGVWWRPTHIDILCPCRFRSILRKPYGLHSRDVAAAPAAAGKVEKRLSPSRCLLCQQQCRGNLLDGFRCPRHFFIWTCY